MVDDHVIFRDGVTSLVSFEEDMEVVGSAGSISQFKVDIAKQNVDVILMDLTIGKEYGVDAINWMHEQGIESKILILSMHKESAHVQKVLDSGVSGYLLKDAKTDEMISAIRLVYSGEKFYSQEIMTSIVNQLTRDKTPKWGLAGQMLSQREVEVLRLIALENSNQEIADALFISIRTVDTHRRNIMSKIDAKNTTSLVKYALKNGLIEL